MKKFASLFLLLAVVSCAKEDKKQPSFCWECTIVTTEQPVGGMAGNQTTDKKDYCNLTESQAGKMNGTRTFEEERFGQVVTLTTSTNCRKK